MRSVRIIRWTLLPIATMLAMAGVAHAAARPAARTFGRAGSNHVPARVVGRLPDPATSGAYVYAEDGTCPDGIDVFSASGTGLTSIQHVTAGGCSARRTCRYVLTSWR